jgi:hypothetical protein
MSRKRQYVILPALTSDRDTGAEEPLPSLDEVARTEFAKSRHALIAEAAYERAQRRAFRDGDAHDDWLRAEVEVDARLERRCRRGYTGLGAGLNAERSQK